MSKQDWTKGAEYDAQLDTYYRTDIIGSACTGGQTGYYTGYFTIEQGKSLFEIETGTCERPLFAETYAEPVLKGE